MSPSDDRTGSAVPADLRAYSRAAVQIDEHIHQLGLRLGRVLDAYRASKPEFGRPLPRIEDDLERYARRCLDIDRRVGQVADAFEHAGSVPQGVTGAGAAQPVVAAEAAIAAALEEARRAAAAQVAAAPAPRPPPTKEHNGHALLGGLIHAVEHPGETLSHAASAVEHAASDALGTVEHAADHRLHDLEAAGASLVHGFEHPGETLDAAASGLEKAAGEVAHFGTTVAAGAASAGSEVLHALDLPGETLAAGARLTEGAAKDLAGGAEHVVGDVVGGAGTAGGAVLHGVEHPGETAAALATGAEHVASSALHGLASLGGGILHAIEHPMDTLSSAEQAAEDFVTGFAAGVKDMTQAAMLLARVIPGTPMWMASMAVDPEGTVRLQEQFAKGLAHMVEHPVDALGNMIDVKDLQSGDYAKWLGHLTPDVIVTVLTMGGGGAAAAAGEGVARTASEATAEQVAKTVAEDAARSVGETTVTAAGEKVAATGPARTMDELTGAAASVDAQEARTLANTVERATRPTSEWAAAHEKPPTLRPLSGEPPRMSVDRWRAPISLEHAAQHAIDHAGPGARWSVTVRGNPQLIGLAFKNAEGVMQRNIARVDAWGLRAGEAPHLNLEVQIQGRPMPKLDPHIAIHMGTP